MSWAKRKNKRNKLGGKFLALPHAMLASSNFTMLSPKGTRLLIDIALQYNGKNNGDLQATWGYAEKRGWKSRDTLNDALRELLHYGFIEKTRQGGLNRCNLFALTWLGIDDCGDKFDAGIRPNRLASGGWRQTRSKFVLPRKQIASTEYDLSRHDSRDNEVPMAA